MRKPFGPEGVSAWEVKKIEYLYICSRTKTKGLLTGGVRQLEMSVSGYVTVSSYNLKLALVLSFPRSLPPALFLT